MLFTAPNPKKIYLQHIINKPIEAFVLYCPRFVLPFLILYDQEEFNHWYTVLNAAKYVS